MIPQPAGASSWPTPRPIAPACAGAARARSTSRTEVSSATDDAVPHAPWTDVFGSDRSGLRAVRAKPLFHRPAQDARALSNPVVGVERVVLRSDDLDA